MCDEPCVQTPIVPFVKKQPNTSELCGQICNGQNLEIDCVRSTKIITQTFQNNLTCTNKIKLGLNITTYDGANDGPGPITIGTNVFVTTTNGNDLTLILDENLQNGCLIYIAHSPDSNGVLTIEGFGGPVDSPPFGGSANISPGMFNCFWKVQGEWLTSTLFQ